MADAVTLAALEVAQASPKQTQAAMQAGRALENDRGELERPGKDGSTIWTEVTSDGLHNRSHGASSEVVGPQSGPTELTNSSATLTSLLQSVHP